MQSHAQVTQKKGLPHVVSEGFRIETPENGEVQVVQVVKYGPKNPSGGCLPGGPLSLVLPFFTSGYPLVN